MHHSFGPPGGFCRYPGVANSPDPHLRRVVREAVHSLHRAVRTLRQHEAEPRLGTAAIERCAAALAAATAAGDLVLELAPGAVVCDGEPVLVHGPGDVPFGALAAAGVGELRLLRSFAPPAAVELVRLLAAAAPRADAEHDIAALLGCAGLPGVELRAATLATPGGDEARDDWWMLPGPGAFAAQFRPLAERDAEVDLVAAAARQLIADLEPDRPGPDPNLLDGLAAAMLARGDAASCAWLLEQAQQHPAIPPALALQLRSRALAAFHSDWLPAQVAESERVAGLTALALQLGEGALQRLAAVAADAGLPLPAWLLDLVPPA